MSDTEADQPLNLIPADLWEAITGESTTPDAVYHIQETAFNLGRPGTSKLTRQYTRMAKDRQECRTLQQQLQDGTPEERSEIFNALFSQFRELISDPSANYVIQKLCEVATPEQQNQMADFFLRCATSVVEHPNGCRVLQKFIETTDTANVDALFEALKGNLIELCRSLNGNHIVQRFITKLPGRIDEIIEILRPQVVELGVDNCGCRVVQKLFDQISIDRLRPLVEEVLKRATTLAENQYGNYVVQSILKSGERSYVSELIKSFTGHFYEFSVHKFASNVIEKCIRGATPAQRQMIFEEVIGDESGDESGYGSDKILRLIKDQFGNYVIQRILEFGTESQQLAIYNVVCDNVDDLRSLNYAKHVISRLERLGYGFGYC